MLLILVNQNSKMVGLDILTIKFFPNSFFMPRGYSSYNDKVPNPHKVPSEFIDYIAYRQNFLNILLPQQLSLNERKLVIHHILPAPREICFCACAVMRWAMNTLDSERRNTICTMKEKPRIETFSGITAELKQFIQDQSTEVIL